MLPTGESEAALTGVRIDPILGPPVLFSFVDGSGRLLQLDCPPPRRSDRPPPFPSSQHRDPPEDESLRPQ